ncbi:unnamed protein product [Notodromas monacha]|uniref:Uncharacterized protein n=1 Tax=Notodromas monacha TaxID=399045 RepID=A0A7R9BHB2_9CRUS|nr:unnamed protein product [Notodromas monacha]CAG0915480.1 unnamed protein product [Notodromas monacha]
MAKLAREPFFVLSAGETQVMHVSFAETSCELTSAYSTGYWSVWDLNVMRERQRVMVSDDPCMYSRKLADNELVAYSRRHGLTVWDDRGCRIMEIPSSHSGFCRPSVLKNLAFLPASDSSVKCYDLKARRTSWIKDCQDFVANKLGLIMCVEAFALPDESCMVFCGFESGTVILLRGRNSEVTFGGSVNVSQESNPCFSLDYDPELRLGVAGSSDAVIRAFDTSEDCEILPECVKKVKLKCAGVNCMKLRFVEPKMLAVSCWDFGVRIFDWKAEGKLHPVAYCPFHSASIESLAFSGTPLLKRKKLFMAAGSMDGKITFWDI